MKSRNTHFVVEIFAERQQGAGRPEVSQMVSTLKFANRRWKLEANPHHIGEFLSLTNSTSWVCLVHIDQYPVIQLQYFFENGLNKRGKCRYKCTMQFHKSVKSQRPKKYPSLQCIVKNVQQKISVSYKSLKSWFRCRIICKIHCYIQ